MNPEIMSFQYATGMRLLLENVGGCEQNRSVANVQNDDLWPSRMHAATHKNYRNRLMWVESIVCNIIVVFLGHSVEQVWCERLNE